eukprot:11273590-Ditylum_brightwellii.AAC.1
MKFFPWFLIRGDASWRDKGRGRRRTNTNNERMVNTKRKTNDKMTSKRGGATAMRVITQYA